MGSLTAHAGSSIAHKYQGVASNRVIQAVQKASARTGVDFAFLMEKASTESGFNPTAKARHSSATGLYQFISDTWLRLVKTHGDRFGLGEYADQIEMRHGKPCVDDCAARDEILNLRNDPEISALMAGAYSADNKAYLKSHTRGGVGSTELYLAHFMGAGGATKFLNTRAMDGDAIAAEFFPHEAHANKTVFYDRAGQPRSFDEIYDLFSHRFSGKASASHAASSPDAAEEPKAARNAPAPASILDAIKHTLALDKGQALPLLDDDSDTGDIIWSDDPRFHRHEKTASRHHAGSQKLSASVILTIAQEAQSATVSSALDRYGYNS